MFVSKQRPVVYPQAEHQRLAGVIAAAMRPELIPLPFDSWVRGVAVHDRGYGELDADPLGAMAEERWLEIETRGVEPQEPDPIVDLVVALHVQRLAGDVARLDAHVPERLAAAGVDPDAAQAADALTNLCDRLAFSFCFEEADAGTLAGLAFTVERDGTATVAPWPFTVPYVKERVTAYEADGYPGQLVPVAGLFDLRPV
jgi:hypothetical protein